MSGPRRSFKEFFRSLLVIPSEVEGELMSDLLLASRIKTSALYLTAQGCGFHLEPSASFLN
jgi:hypothetical protein